MAELRISMGGRTVGVLDGTDPRNLTITYDDAWASDPTATPLSLSLPIGTGRHSGSAVEPYLWGLLPDNEVVVARWAADHQVSARNVFGLLAHLGSDVAGAATYRPEAALTQPSRESALMPVTDADVAEMLRGVRRDSAAWHPLRYPGRWSLAGMQGKIALAYDERARQWSVPQGEMPTTHILKPAIAGLDHHDVNEHLCLVAAGAVGLRVARTSIETFEGERALVVRRYDRLLGPDGSVLRVHQEDFCQALSVPPARKYENEGGPGADDMTRLLRAVAPRSAAADVEALSRAMAFNWLVLGTDAHAKNYSLLLSGSQVRLAPLYDLASAAPYGDHVRKLRMAQKIGGEYRPAFIRRRHWERLASTAGVDGEVLCADIARMALRLPDAFTDAVRSAALSKPEAKAAASLVDALAPWLAQCASAVA